MSRMRGVDAFEELWKCRTTITDDDSGIDIHLMALPDLVAAKMTQRDKDWPMIRRLVEANMAQNREKATEAHLRFWLSNSRTSEHLIWLAADNPEVTKSMLNVRPLLKDAQRGNVQAVDEERRVQVAADQQYWKPLKKELELLRQSHRS